MRGSHLTPAYHEPVAILNHGIGSSL